MCCIDNPLCNRHEKIFKIFNQMWSPEVVQYLFSSGKNEMKNPSNMTYLFFRENNCIEPV